MHDLLILGTGVHAAEMVEIVDRVNCVREAWNLLGCVSNGKDNPPGELNGCPIFPPSVITGTYASARLVPAYGWPGLTDLPRDRCVSLIDPTVFVSRTAQIGVGCVIYPHCVVGAYARVGDFVFSLSGSVINHHDVIEDRVAIATAVTLAGQVHVEADCYLGQSSTCRQLLRIGRGSLIGMGSVIIKDVPPNSVMVGNPARRLRDNTPSR
jgi:sugar O-acyltransferase (sialic acid O-acetyltransferase NeuD family)